MSTPTRKEAVVELVAKDLNANGGIFCPSAKADMKLWNTHPRVYLDIAQSLHHSGTPFLNTAVHIRLHRQRELSTDLHDRVEGGDRLLEAARLEREGVVGPALGQPHVEAQR